MFDKGNFKNGMVVEFNDGNRRLVWEGRLIDSCGFIPLHFIDKDLVDMDSIKCKYITKVYLTKNVCSFNDFFREKNLTCIWTRDNEEEK